MNAIHNSYMRDRPDLPWPPSREDERSRVIRGQLWRLEEIHAIAQVHLLEGRRVVPITDDCVEDLQKLSFDPADVAQLVIQLTGQHYDKSMWCRASAHSGVRVREEQLWYPCDAYAMTRRERIAASEWEGNVDYYLKVCLNSAKSVILLLSVHLQN